MLKKESEIKNSIIHLRNKSDKEKNSLSESIELLWLNADIQRKKDTFEIPSGSDENILRIRQLLACAWFEDFKS